MYRNLSRFNKGISCKHLFNFHVCQRASSHLHQLFQPDKKAQKFSSIFSNYGFNQGQINGILRSPNSILSYSEEDLLSNLNFWLSFEVNDKLYTALSAYPELLTLNPDYIKNRVKELMTLFTKKDINKLLVTCPSVILEDFSTIYDKVEYIVHMMGVEQKSMVKSRALQHDLHHIKCRHTFMVRAGCYIVNKKTAKNRNPPLHKIFSQNMKTFLKLTRLTEEEYNAFCLSYKEELLDQEDSDDDEDIDFKS